MKRTILYTLLFFIFAPLATASGIAFASPGTQGRMMYKATTRVGVSYAKDPHVVKFKGRYLMYYSIPPSHRNGMERWSIGIAKSKDLIHWMRAGEITPRKDLEYERKGMCAPCAIVKDGRVHLFYQTYGNRERDAICHAVSKDGLHFKRDTTNPIFHPQPADWTCGRAIDAEVALFKGKYYLYYATRDPEFKTQKIGVAVAEANTDFSRGEWREPTEKSILYPILPWEKACIEAPSVIVRDSMMYMFYAGGYNNKPQQIGLATSKDGINFERIGPEPFKQNGREGKWNASESGHPHVFRNSDGKTYLFFQENNDDGKTWLISQEEIAWKKTRQGRSFPYLNSERERFNKSRKIFEDYDELPHYAGEPDKKLGDFIKENIHFPESQTNAHGRVIVSFLVDIDGNTSDFKISKGINPELDAEALRVARLIKMRRGYNQWTTAKYSVVVDFKAR